MNGSYMQRGTADTGRGRSPKVWEDFPWENIQAGVVDGVADFEDFTRGGLLTAPSADAAEANLVEYGLSAFSTDASNISLGNPTWTNSSGSQDLGTLILAETTTAESTSVRRASAPYRISANFGLLCFEARIKISSVATNEISFALGLMEDTAVALQVPLLVSSTHALADKNFVGFHKPVADTTTFDATYKANGVTAVEVNGAIGSLAADTYVKLGFRFDPRDNYLRYFINNVEQATAKLIPDNTGTDFPADVPLGFVLGLGVGSAASDNTLTCDWFRIGMVLI